LNRVYATAPGGLHTSSYLETSRGFKSQFPHSPVDITMKSVW